MGAMSWFEAGSRAAARVTAARGLVAWQASGPVASEATEPRRGKGEAALRDAVAKGKRQRLPALTRAEVERLKLHRARMKEEVKEKEKKKETQKMNEAKQEAGEEKKKVAKKMNEAKKAAGEEKTRRREDEEECTWL